MNKFSIVIPTYSGEDFLPGTLDSLLSQNGKHDFELIIVIDGPNDNLKKIAEDYRKKFLKNKTKVTIKQFKENKGRFTARYEGAKLAKNDILLFADDRNTMDKNYLIEIFASKARVLIPNVLQINDKTPISKTLYLIRKFVYKKWGENFESYYIDNNNFEKSAKGTTGLFVPKNIFIEICSEIINPKIDSKNVSDDTKLLKGIISRGEKIFRCSEAKIYYQSRTKFKEEIKHLYERGPKFLDYYMKPGTRFFLPLIMCVMVFVFFVIMLILHPTLLLAVLLLLGASLIFLSIIISSDLREFCFSLFGLTIIVGIFSLGVLRGLLSKTTTRIMR